MNAMNVEPRRLSRGKKVHAKLQREWIRSSGGRVTTERRITKPNRRKGRVDIFVEISDKNDRPYFAVVEIKNSNWNNMKLEAVRRNVERQASQIWDYVESNIRYSGDSAKKRQPAGKRKRRIIKLVEYDIFPGVVFPKRPRDPRRRDLIERLFERKGISVVWDDESIGERRVRSWKSPG